MYTKGMIKDSSPYIRGSNSAIAKAMSADSGAYVNRRINSQLADGITSGTGGLTSWTNPDLQTSIGASEFSWSLTSYDPKTKTAIVTVVITDTFDFTLVIEGILVKA